MDVLAPDSQVCAAGDPNSRREDTLPARVPSAVAQAPAARGTSLASTAGPRRPNIVFVLADDLSFDLVRCMPHAHKMQKDGVTFANYFVTNSLCCPSRASIFTGRYPHNTGIYENSGPNGGYLEFLVRGHEEATFATALTSADYRTAMLGKYLNLYQPGNVRIPPGWSEWDVAGDGYRGFDYDLNENARIVHYANTSGNYLTDVLSAKAVDFIKRQTSGAPFMIEIATFAPHTPYIPAPRDAFAFAKSRAPRTPAFDAGPDIDAPKWLGRMPPLSEADVAGIDAEYRKRTQAVLAIDAMIGAIKAAVIEIGAPTIPISSSAQTTAIIWGNTV